MGTIAEKLTYLNTTKIKLRDSLNKFGSSILSTDTFRSYDTKLNEIYDKLPKVTQSGAGFTLENVQNGLLDDFKMIGVDLEQDTTTGKQLFDINSEINTNSLIDAGITSTFNEDGTITVNGEKTANYKYIRYSVTLPAGTYYFCGCPSGGSNSSYSSLVQLTQDVSSQVFDIGNGGTFTLTEQTTIQYFPVRVGSASLTFNNTIFRPMISTSPVTYDDFEKYTGGIASPNPDYPQEIKVVEGRQVITDSSKNLLKPHAIEDTNNGITVSYDEETQVYTFNGTCTQDNTTFMLSNVNINLTANVTKSITYWIGGSCNNYCYMRHYSSGYSLRCTYSISELNENNPKIVTTSQSTFLSPASLNTIIFNNGSVATNFKIKVMVTDDDNTDYEPYYEPVDYNIDLNSENLSNGVNENYWINTNVDSAGKSGTNSGLAINVSNYNIVEITTSKSQQRYRVACVNSLPVSSSQVSVYRGINKDNTSSSITINTAGYNYLIINATDLTKINVYYKYELAKMPNTTYKNRIYRNNGNWYFEENVKKYIFNSAKVLAVNDYQSSSTGTSKNGTYSIVVSDMPISLRNDKMMSTEYSYELNSNVTDNYSAQTNMTNNTFCLRQGTNDRIYFKCSDYANKTASEISTAIENESMYYVLGNPVTTQITNTTLIDQLEAISVHTGTNIITISNDNNIIPEIEITRLKELEKLA